MTPDQTASYRREGFLQVSSAFGAAELDACRARVDWYMKSADSPAIYRFGENGERIHCKIPQLAERDEIFRRLAQDSAVSRIVEDLIGPALIFRDVLIAKPPIAGAVVHYHQDAAYWDVDRPDLVLSAWIALDPAPAESGCLQMIPGSHATGVPHTLRVGGRALPPFATRALRRATSLTGTGDKPKTATQRAFARAKKLILGSATRIVPGLNDLNDLRIDPDQISMDRMVTLPARAGDVIFFSSQMIHGSGPNRSANLRSGYIVTYMSVDCRVPQGENQVFLPATSKGPSPRPDAAVRAS